MKNILRKGIVIVAVLSVLLSLTACISTDEAKIQANELLSCLGEGDYEAAAVYMHPDSPITAELMRSTVEEYAKAGVDLSIGIDKISYNSIQSSYYDSNVDGKRLELGGVATLNDGTEFDVSFIFIDNDSGYGIWQFSASISR